ncbi:MAG: hypothetical protein MZV63_61875 [Marinilabiliales bacterium]|nr:hypothetical protein [Marinilabiliales bacterium]
MILTRTTGTHPYYSPYYGYWLRSIPTTTITAILVAEAIISCYGQAIILPTTAATITHKHVAAGADTAPWQQALTRALIAGASQATHRRGTYNSRRTSLNCSRYNRACRNSCHRHPQNRPESGTTTKAGTTSGDVATRPEYTRRDAAGNAVQSQTRTQSQVRPPETQTQSQTRHSRSRRLRSEPRPVPQTPGSTDSSPRDSDARHRV